jgi:hypothetical protein
MTAFEERSARRVGGGGALGMPLDGDEPAGRAGPPHRLDGAVRRSGGDGEAASQPVHPDADDARILRSVLMKSESEGYVDHLRRRLERLARP